MQSEKKSIAAGTHGITIACVLLAIVTLPLLGVTLAGGAIHHYLEFPPFTRSVTHEPFSWAIFIGGALLVAAMFVPFLARVVRTMRYGSRAPTDRFPWWGWIAIGWTLLAWSLAWSRLGWMDSIQGLTFTPLWLGFIVTVNALTFRRIGHCMMLHRPRYFLSLFTLSALFWWSFEYLNRFVQNWYYLGGQELTAWEYLWQATLSFSTVLPAVLGTAEWLSTYRRQVVDSDPGTVGGIADRVAWGWGLLCAAAACLLGLGLWPDFLFFLVWVAPLLLITALQWIRHEPTIWDDTRHEGWGVLWTVAFAALLCGFFWELWNFYSLAHWEYAVPFVHRFQVFHMPLLGYAGYLPFGLECLAVADLCLTRKFSGGAAYYRAAGGGIDLAQRKPTVGER